MFFSCVPSGSYFLPNLNLSHSFTNLYIYNYINLYTQIQNQSTSWTFRDFSINPICSPRSSFQLSPSSLFSTLLLSFCWPKVAWSLFQPFCSDLSISLCWTGPHRLGIFKNPIFRMTYLVHTTDKFAFIFAMLCAFVLLYQTSYFLSFLCMNILPACTYVQHVCAWHP